MTEIAIGILCLVVGVLIGRFLLKKLFVQAAAEAQKKANLIIKEAELSGENIKKNKIFEAKEKYLKLKSDFNNEVNKYKNQQVNEENRLKQLESKLKQHELKIRQKEINLSRQQEELKKRNEGFEKAQNNIERQLAVAEKKIKESDTMLKEQVKKLEKIAHLSADEARQQLVEALKNEAQTKASMHIKQIMEEANLKASKEAKKILITAIQRTSAEHSIENCISVFNLESDQLKGKIIGREGRNIRALEACTGVEIIVDDTPEAIIISGFDPVRREVARTAMHRLMADGRIHPARIEEVVEKTRRNIEDEIVEIGEKTIIDLGIHGLHPELVKLVGRMRFRSSYGQNLLQHSREVARLCTTLSAELGLSPKACKRAGLLHDVGKVWHEESEQPHAILGMEIAKKYNESTEVCNAIGAHHDEIEMKHLISPIVQACDAISGSRPGARREMMQSYIQRLKDLEEMAVSFNGVSKCYAMQAGRELRIMVDAENVSDEHADNLSFEISQKIEREMQYPGQIKIAVIREKRAVHYAK